jgi:hypothetical protein
MKTYSGIMQLIRIFRTLAWLILALSVLLACSVVVMPLLGGSDALPTSLRVFLGASVGGFIGIGFLAAGVAYSSVLFFSAAVIELLLDIQVNTYEGKMLLHRALTKPKSDKKESSVY